MKWESGKLKMDAISALVSFGELRVARSDDCSSEGSDAKGVNAVYAE